MPSSKQSEIDQQKLLPWLVNGTLDDDEKRHLETALEKSAELRKEKDFLTQLQQSINEQKAPAVPLEFSWQRLKRDINDSQQLSSTKSPSTMNWRNIAIAASFVLVVQTSIIMLPESQQTTYTTLSSDASQPTPKTNPVITVRFNSELQQAALQQFLLENELQIISGPSAAGLYQLSSTEISDDLIVKLESNSLVIEFVQKND
jgi:anti-sigma-K factor RskA